MYPNAKDYLPCSTNEFVFAGKKPSTKPTKQSVQHSSKSKKAQRTIQLRNPRTFYQERQNGLLHSPVVPVIKSPSYFCPWKGPYVIKQHINDVIYCIEVPLTNRQLVVHYDPFQTIQAISTDTKRPHKRH